MDGVSTMDTGQQRRDRADERGVDRRSQGAESGYQAEYGRSSGLQVTAVTKSGTNRFRGSLYNVRRDSDWNANSKTNILNGDSEAVSKAAGHGLLDRRPGREAGRQQQAVLLLRPGVPSAHRGGNDA